MRILEVDGSGVRRVTAEGAAQSIDISIFRWVVERLLAGETVTRSEIHERAAPRRVSSGVLLILGSVPGFEPVMVGRRKGRSGSAPAPR